MMSYVKAGSLERVCGLFPPFPVEVNDRYITIKTYNDSEPMIHCVRVLTPRKNSEGVVYPPGMYVYAVSRRGGDRAVKPSFWYNDLEDDAPNDLIDQLNIKNVFSDRIMFELGFKEPATKGKDENV